MAANKHKRSHRPELRRSRAIRKALPELIAFGMSGRARTLVKVLASRMKNQHQAIEFRSRMEGVIGKTSFGKLTDHDRQVMADCLNGR